MNKIDFEKLDFAQLKLIRRELEENFKEELFTLGNHHYTKYLSRSDVDNDRFDLHIDETILRLDDIIHDIAEVEEQILIMKIQMSEESGGMEKVLLN